MKKFLLALGLTGVVLSTTSCGLKTVIESKEANTFVQIDDVPEGWSGIDDSYVYETDTKIVYIRSLGIYSISYTKLESKEYCGYTYDAKNNKFVGFNR